MRWPMSANAQFLSYSVENLRSGDLSADTWDFSCCPRYDAAMAYDSRLKQMVVFGGYGARHIVGSEMAYDPRLLSPDRPMTGAPTR